MTNTEFQVTGMHCGGCEASVREEVSAIDGVNAVEVSAATGRLVVSASDDLADDAVLTAVREAGYEAVKAS